MKKNIFLALDFDSLDKALDVTDQTKEYLAGIKIGLELYSVIGLQGIKELEKFKLPIFLDTKIFDDQYGELSIDNNRFIRNINEAKSFNLFIYKF